MKRSLKIISLLSAFTMCTGITSAAADTKAIPMDPYGFEDWFRGDEFVFGDCNLDGVFSVDDAIMLQNYLLGKGKLTDLARELADFTFDGKLNAADLTAMKRQLMLEMQTYSSAQYISADENYRIILNITTKHNLFSKIKLQWYDPDGDLEKTDTFTVDHGNPFSEDGEWETAATYTNSESYWITWGKTAVTIKYLNSEADFKEITLDYPDRTKIQQNISQEISYREAPEIESVDISAESYGNLGIKASAKSSGNVLSRDTAGRVGAPLSVTVKDSIEAYTVTIHYDEDQLRWVPENNLIVLAFDPKSNFQVFQEITDAVLDTENNTITFSGSKSFDYIMADAYQWHFRKQEYAYPTPDITQYESDWERAGQTGDIMRLADKEWARDNLDRSNNTFTVSTAEELASAVYYINASRDLERLGGTAKYNIALAADIDLAGYEWTPITAFSRTLNGNGHTIKNMQMTGTGSETGFIGNANYAKIQDISFENAEITANRTGYAGIVAGKALLPGTTLTNVTVSGTITAGSNVSCGNGGIICSGSASLKNCIADVIINGEAIYAEYTDE